MNYLLIIEAQNSPELLERLLRIVRHRGFIVQKLIADASEDEQSLHVTLTVFSERTISLLSKQIEKTFGIKQVTILEHNAENKAPA